MFSFLYFYHPIISGFLHVSKHLGSSDHVIFLWSRHSINTCKMNKWIIFYWLLHFSYFKVTKFGVSSPSILLIAVSSNNKAERQRIKPTCRTLPVQRNHEPLTCSYVSNTRRRIHYTHPEPSKDFCHKSNTFVTQKYFSSGRKIFFLWFHTNFSHIILRKGCLSLLIIPWGGRENFFFSQHRY